MWLVIGLYSLFGIPALFAVIAYTARAIKNRVAKA